MNGLLVKVYKYKSIFFQADRQQPSTSKRIEGYSNNFNQVEQIIPKPSGECIDSEIF